MNAKENERYSCKKPELQLQCFEFIVCSGIAENFKNCLAELDKLIWLRVLRNTLVIKLGSIKMNLIIAVMYNICYEFEDQMLEIIHANVQWKNVESHILR